MEQRIGFCSVPGGRIAYAETGDGPPLVLPAPWVSHLERDWEFPEYRAFVTALARTHRVVRYDRLGTGLSDRPPLADSVLPGVGTDDVVLGALLDALGLDRVALLGISVGSCAAIRYAATHPDRVTRLALVGGFADGAASAPAALQESIVATIRAHWGAGSRLLADVWIPGADARVRDAFARLQRDSADADTAASVLASVYGVDVRAALPHVQAPTLVLHRRDDRAIPFTLGREVAAGIPGARLRPLDGVVHPPWLEDSAAVLAALTPFLTPAVPSDGAQVGSAPSDGAVVSGARAGGEASGGGDGRLTERERDVLRLVAAGHSDAEIAAALVVSAHTVHRHVANIRRKLDQPTRAAAAAAAIRRGLI
ncbi:alpha/beta fold hydrolase [Cryptosporangium aurantiacum]|uniref:Pimeloyl-ACP methyl ester carboxylesterase n=1 Tax=Cryptosporangium aurantiacum TaxID=134849 RepID=A0A1M7RNF8_9ACTN|nr:alpha/beta fold hydrolase [Cryptosporangium aurantiacum]SHN47877.1 Pimeloyl-ACP methyl ester carboxylesterase [Cryptosporangium aurantiacum]